MTVGELKELLEAFDEDAEIIIWNNDRTYSDIDGVARDENGDVGINWVEPR